MVRILVIDNYDSFVYNIAQCLGRLGAECDVVRNDAVTAGEAVSGAYDAVVISPGPGSPDDPRSFGVCGGVIRAAAAARVPLLGVCLGHQGIISAFGGRVVGAARVRHGKTSPVRHTGAPLFRGVKSPFLATRYHSLVGDRAAIPDSLEVTATADDDSEVMAVRHRECPVQGVQFHPESIMTGEGMRILANFVDSVRGAAGGEEGAAGGEEGAAGGEEGAAGGEEGAGR